MDKSVNKNILLYNSEVSPYTFDFDKLQAPPIGYYLSQEDIKYLNKIATSLKWSGNINKKYKAMDDLMRSRGFLKYACGTNRRVYRCIENDFILFKIALDRVGIEDNPKELFNQHLLKPFVTKMFECTPCGTISCVERVKPIKTRTEFISVAGDVFDMLHKKVIGKYILEDIGDSAFMNYGIREGFGVVLLDYPYLYETDLSKLKCNECSGYIDYDTGLNTLHCQECGKIYTARELAVPIKIKEDNYNSFIIEDRDENIMKKFRFKVISDNGEVLVDNSHRESEFIY